MNVGDKIWCHDYRSHRRPWFDETITGETRQSWLVGFHGAYKVNKKTMQENCGTMGHRQWYTETAKYVRLWLGKHPRAIAAQVETCKDVDLLLKIAALVGYEAEAPALPNGERA